MALYLGSKKVSPTKTITKEVSSMKPFFDAGGKCAYSIATTFEGIIQYSDTSNVTDMSYMFSNCSPLTTIPLLDTSNVTDMSCMFRSCYSLTSIPQLDTSNVISMYNMFFYCTSLTSIQQLDTSNVTNMNGMFDYCPKLEEIHMINMKVSFDIHYSTKFTREALLEIINNCYDLTTLGKTATLTMGSTNLAKLTEEDKAIATAKGWTLK